MYGISVFFQQICLRTYSVPGSVLGFRQEGKPRLCGLKGGGREVVSVPSASVRAVGNQSRRSTVPATVRRNLENVMLSERSQSHKVTYGMIPSM